MKILLTSKTLSECWLRDRGILKPDEENHGNYRFGFTGYEDGTFYQTLCIVDENNNITYASEKSFPITEEWMQLCFMKEEEKAEWEKALPQMLKEIEGTQFEGEFRRFAEQQLKRPTRDEIHRLCEKVREYFQKEKEECEYEKE